MRADENPLDWALRSFPEHRERLLPYVEQAETYRNECGCSLGGALATAALGLLLLDLLVAGVRSFNPTNAAVAAAIVFVAGIVGKLSGIGIARARLALLYRRVRIEYPPGD